MIYQYSKERKAQFEVIKSMETALDIERKETSSIQKAAERKLKETIKEKTSLDVEIYLLNNFLRVNYTSEDYGKVFELSNDSHKNNVRGVLHLPTKSVSSVDVGQQRLVFVNAYNFIEQEMLKFNEKNGLFQNIVETHQTTFVEWDEKGDSLAKLKAAERKNIEVWTKELLESFFSESELRSAKITCTMLSGEKREYSFAWKKGLKRLKNPSNDVKTWEKLILGLKFDKVRIINLQVDGQTHKIIRDNFDCHDVVRFIHKRKQSNDFTEFKNTVSALDDYWISNYSTYLEYDAEKFHYIKKSVNLLK